MKTIWVNLYRWSGGISAHEHESHYAAVMDANNWPNLIARAIKIEVEDKPTND